jgi:hypothetical protein
MRKLPRTYLPRRQTRDFGELGRTSEFPKRRRMSIFMRDFKAEVPTLISPRRTSRTGATSAGGKWNIGRLHCRIHQLPSSLAPIRPATATTFPTPRIVEVGTQCMMWTCSGPGCIIRHDNQFHEIADLLGSIRWLQFVIRISTFPAPIPSPLQNYRSPESPRSAPRYRCGSGCK